MQNVQKEQIFTCGRFGAGASKCSLEVADAIDDASLFSLFFSSAILIFLGLVYNLVQPQAFDGYGCLARN